MTMHKIYLAVSLASLSMLGCSRMQSAFASSTATASSAGQADTVKVEAPTCPGKDFTSFLRSFAADAKVRDQFTAPIVHVTDWKNVDEPNEGESTIDVPKAGYRDFTLRYMGGAFHHADADGKVDSDPVNIQIEKQKNGYLVGYRYGMSEGNSWLFQSKDQCWYLIADPEPPTE